MKKKGLVFAMGCLLSCMACSSQSDIKRATLTQSWEEFSHPQDSTRTKVWWFHGETETTREGITADLEAYKRAGVGGVVYYDQVHGKCENALRAFEPEWWDMLRFAASEAKRIGLSFEINLSNGFVAGGPWITKKLGMQRLTASDTLVTGGKHLSAILPVPGRSEFWDVAVLAFPAPQDAWQTSRDRKPKVTCSLPQLSGESLLKPGGSMVEIPLQPSGKSIYVNLDFGGDFTARSISYRIRPRGAKSSTGAMNPPGPPADSFYGMGYQKLPDVGQLEVSDDGVNYRKVCDLKPIYQTPSNRWTQKTISFSTITGRYFRLNLHDWALPKDNRPNLSIGDIQLSSRARIDQWEERAALYSEYIEKNLTPDYLSSTEIDPSKIVDLTEKMDKNGRLEWDAPQGNWVIMRFAHEPTGATIRHGRANFMGLECDKMSVEAVTTHWRNYTEPILDSLQLIGCLPMGVTMDSHEGGSQNWTPGFEKEFLQRKGYSMHRYLPVMMGYVVGSVTESDGFLYDMRRTMADMISDNYYGTLQKLCDERGVDFTAQATGNGLSLVADNLQAKGRVYKPQGEFWTSHPDGGYDVKETSSAAHFYGKHIASAEAFTGSRFYHNFADQKNSSDYAYAFGVNEFVLCASAYQPWIDKYPGSTAGGKHYCLNRNNTYWEYSRPFWDYQARCTGLMRRGMPVVDICVYVGQNPPVKLLTYRLPEIPEGYDFDVCTAEALVTRTTAADGRLTLPDGMSYRILVIQRNNDMPLQVLRHIAELVKGGVTVCGPRPEGSGSLKDAAEAKEYQALVEELWGAEGDNPASGMRIVGKGKLYTGLELPEVLIREGVRPDIAIKSGNTAKDKVYFTHRRLSDADVYYLNNHSKRTFNDTIRLRTKAHYAEYWDAVTGRRFALPVEASGDEGMLLKFVLAPRESGFIVTSDHSNTNLLPRIANVKEDITSIDGSWNVYFDPKWGGPGEVVFNELIDWTKHTDSAIRFYSGTAVYRKEISIAGLNKNERVLLRFPHLGSLARVWVNEKEVATVWCSPWEADITDYVNKGNNSLKIEVVNSLMNRMIGDASLPQEERYTYAYPEIATPKDKLVSSGIVKEVLLVKQIF